MASGDDMMDLFSQVISKLPQPTYAVARRTGTPIIFGNNIDKEGGLAPGEGRTYDVGGLTPADRMGLLIRHPSLASTVESSPTDRGAMYVEPGGPADAYTLRHEAIHNVLDAAGMKDKDYQTVMDTMPHAESERLRNLYNRSSRGGWVGDELPAYLGAYQPKDDGFVVPKSLRDLYLNTMNKYLSAKNPQRAKQYQQMIVSKESQ